MEDNVKKMIKQINDGKNLEIYIPSYATGLMDTYYKYSLLRLTMQYYTLYEVASEEESETLDEIKDTLLLINQTIASICSTGFTGEKTQSIVQKLDDARVEIIQKMQILTAYIDRIQIYEYVLNRMELNFEEKLDWMDDSLFSQKLVQFIFESKDNIVINDKIREIIGQLPVRMSRNKYFELIKDSLSIYKGGDKSSVDSYLYMLETCSMLYEPEGMDNQFTQFGDLIRELDTVQYGNLTKEEHGALVGKIPVAAAQITGITDLYLSLQEILNNLYVLVLANPYAMVQDEPDMKICKEIIGIIHQQFETKTYPMIPTSVEEKLELLEGVQEGIFETCALYDSALFELKANHKNLIESLMLEKIFESLYLMQKLLSSSIFIDIQKEESNEIADTTYISQVTQELILKLSQMFKKNQTCINRAVIANTLSRMPVFFNSSDEVVEYINSSLLQCHDKAEKNVCIKILESMIEDEQQYQNF